MFYIIVFFSEFFFLFLISQTLTKLVSLFFYRITHNKKLTLCLIALLFFPGTCVHELSHYFMARILFVKVYQIEFFPKLEGTNVKLGSVLLARSDIFRRLLIGMAPFFVGTTILLGTLYSVVKCNLIANWGITFIVGYILFEIGNTMFSSKKDMEGAIELLTILFIIIAICFFFHIPFPFINNSFLLTNPVILKVLQKGILYLSVPIGLDLVSIVLLRLMR
jgi:hypothetical protein